MHDKLPAKQSRVLISDYDGTMTRFDFFDRVLARLAGESLPDYWGEYVAGQRTHFDALRSIYSHRRGGEQAALALAREAELDPQLAPAVRTLSEAGWEVIVVSAGSAWYIERLLHERNVELTIISNPGRIAPNGSLEMLPPTDSPFYSPEFGVDKLAVVRWALERYEEVAYAGDGRPDESPARIVASSRRFARGWLAERFAADGTPFRRFECWSEIAGMLAGEQASAS
jgi:2,3-diketo-5-methylthio-1-phosphopentane phosphatase